MSKPENQLKRNIMRVVRRTPKDEEITIRKKIVKRDEPKIISHEVLKTGQITYAGKPLHSIKYTFEGMTYTKLKEFIKKKSDQLSNHFPDGQMNVSIKYESQPGPISTKYFKLGDTPNLKAPYVYNEDEDDIQYIYVQMTY